MIQEDSNGMVTDTREIVYFNAIKFDEWAMETYCYCWLDRDKVQTKITIKSETDQTQKMLELLSREGKYIPVEV